MQSTLWCDGCRGCFPPSEPIRSVQIQSIRAYLLDYGDSKDRFDCPLSMLAPCPLKSEYFQLLRTAGAVRVRTELCTTISKAKDVAKSGIYTARTVSG